VIKHHPNGSTERGTERLAATWQQQSAAFDGKWQKQRRCSSLQLEVVGRGGGLYPRVAIRRPQKEDDMKRKLAGLVFFAVAVLATALYHAGKVWATASNGFTAKTLAKGTLAEFDVFNQFPAPGSDVTGDQGNIWLSLEKTKGASDLYVQSNSWKAVDPVTGAIASTGWHSHPGHSLIIVTAGTITDYEADDPACTPHVYTVGMSFVDAGGSHVHLIRNEGTVPASNIAVQLIPAGTNRRIDAPQPANCPGIE
jgi:hypothetical protein